MGDSNDSKRKKSKHDDEDDERREKRSKRARSRSPDRSEGRDQDSSRKRKHSRSPTPDKRVKEEKRRDEAPKDTEVKKEAPERKKKETDMLNTRTGGAYIPPARLRMMQAQITDKSSVAYQRLAWEALKKSIHGHINKINIGNIGIIIKELLKENIVRGRGLLCRSVIQAQAASPTFTNVYAALVAAVNSRFPNIGELLLKRLVIQFKRGFKRNDKAICISSVMFIAHLVNQRVAHEILALELLTLLVESPTDDSVEVSIAFLKECGQKLTEVSSKGVNAIFEMLRNILHEGQLDKRVQYMIEVMFQVWKDGFKDHPAVIEELELVPEEEQFTHLLMLDEATDAQDILNVFKFDEKYEENEQKYKTLSKEILGSDAESGEGSGESGSEESDDEEEEEEGEKENKVTIIDNTETNLIALRRTIYLTINSSLDFEECAHKLLKMQLKPGQEIELCHMFLDCCAEQRTYEKFYGLLAQRFCNINRIYIDPFEQIFKDSYGTAHRLDTNRLRNVSKFFAHLLFTDSISWEVLECVRLNEEDTTSSSRIYIKILFQELAEYMGLKKLNDRLKDPTLQEAFGGVFPRDNPKNTRFSINFFTSIGLGGLTDELREHLKQMPKALPPPPIALGEDDSSSSSSSDSSSDSSSSSDSEEESTKKKSDKKKKLKSSKKKDKDKSPKTTEQETPQDKNVERWGHDGFYDTYGKDARRHESNNEKDFNFAKPFDKPRRRTDDSRKRDDNSRKRDDDNGRRDNDSGRRDTDSRKRDDGQRDGNKEDFNFVKPYDKPRKRNNDSRKRDDDSGRRDNDSRKRDDDSGRRDNDSRKRDERNGNEQEFNRRGNDSKRNNGERAERGRDDSQDGRRDSMTDEGYWSRKEDDHERYKRSDDRKRRDDERSRKDEDRSRKDDGRSSRKEKSRDDPNSKRDDENNDRSDRSSRDDDKRSKRDDRSTRDNDTDRRGDKKSRREESPDRDDRSRSEDDRGRKVEGKTKDKSRDVDKSRKEIKKEKDERTRKEIKKERDGKENRKKAKDSSSEDSSSSSSDSDSESSSSSSEGDRSSRKRDQSRPDGWDIRGSSIKREIPTNRYWDNKN